MCQVVTTDCILTGLSECLVVSLLGGGGCRGWVTGWLVSQGVVLGDEHEEAGCDGYVCVLKLLVWCVFCGCGIGQVAQHVPVQLLEDMGCDAGSLGGSSCALEWVGSTRCRVLTHVCDVGSAKADFSLYSCLLAVGKGSNSSVVPEKC